MILRANRKSLPWTGVALALALTPSIATARRAPPPEPVRDPNTARMVVEKQLAAHATTAQASLGSLEAHRIRDRYVNRIGVQLEVQDTSSDSGHGN